jgi:hypothetical protein
MARSKKTNPSPKKVVDLSKVDISNDFRDFPQLYSTPEDIQKYIGERKLDVPVLSHILKLRETGKLDATPTELEFYFAELFDYIYDVYRVPVPETYRRMDDWLQHIELELVYGGFAHVRAHAYEFALNRYRTHKESEAIFKDIGVERDPLPQINCVTKLEIEHHPQFYISTNPKLIESFWIHSSRHSGQPERVGDEAYMRVHVYPDRVYIMGCDDCSYTLRTKNADEAKAFAEYLKTAAPVWCFGNFKQIHKDLEFTN